MSSFQRFLAFGLHVIFFCSAPSSFAETESTSPEIPAIYEISIGEDTAPVALAFAMESDGFLLTPYTVLLMPPHDNLATAIQARRIGFAPLESTWQSADIIGVEPTLGLAILKIEVSSPIPALPIQPPLELQPGDTIHAVAATAQHVLQEQPGTFTQENSLDCYQMDMTSALFKGVVEIPATGLGSPIFTPDGTVHAIHTGYEPGESNEEEDEPEHTHHFVPISLALNVYAGIKQRGNLESPWTGYSVRNLSYSEKAIFPAYNGHVKGGIAIATVWDESPASALGIKPDDILVKFGHYPIYSVGDFQKWLYMYGVGHTVKMYFLKNDKLSVKNYTIEPRPDWAKPR